MVLTATTWGISYWSCRIIAEAWLSLGQRPTQKGWGICKRIPRKNIDRFSSLITNQSNFPAISRYLPLGPHFLHHLRWAAYQSPSSRPGCSSRHPGPACLRETSPAAAGSGTARFCRLHLWPWMGLSENSVPNDPMVLLIIIPTKWLFHWGYTPFSDIPGCPKLPNVSRNAVYPKTSLPCDNLEWPVCLQIVVLDSYGLWSIISSITKGSTIRNMIMKKKLE